MTSSFAAKKTRVCFKKLIEKYKKDKNKNRAQSICNLLKSEKIEYQFFKIEGESIGWQFLLKGKEFNNFNLFESCAEEKIRRLEKYRKVFILVFCDGENAITVSEDSFLFSWEEEKNKKKIKKQKIF